MFFPKISVVIPSFNQGHFIERTILSILKQDYEGEIEIIVSDGGSTDDTSEILKKYNSQIVWWSEKDRGYADAVTKGFKVAKGELFAIQSSDDYYLQGAFIKLTKLLSEHKEAVLVCGKEAIQEADGTVFSGYELPEKITPLSFLLEHKFPGIFQHTTIFRRAFYELTAGMKNEFDLCADADLFYRMLHFGPGYFLNSPISVYQKHEEQRTYKQAPKFKKQMVSMVKACLNDPKYSKHFVLSKKQLDQYQKFITLFYLQYENPEKAKVMAEGYINNKDIDQRTLELAGAILKPKHIGKTSPDNWYTKQKRRVKRIISKYLYKQTEPQRPALNYAQQINANWWSFNS
jgi:glycosyltransferase involved in cell wall biosynthesis